MKICLFTENYYRGGLDTFIINLLNSWPDPEDELTFVCNGTHPGIATILEKTRRPVRIQSYYRLFTSSIAQGQSLVRCGRWFPVRVFFILAFRVLEYPVLFFWYVTTLALLFRRSDFDRLLVVNGGYPASLLCRSAIIGWRVAGKRPLAILNFHNSTTSAPWYSRLPEHIIDTLVKHSAAQIISVSSNCLESLRNRPAFRNCSKLSFIYNGIEDPIISVRGVSGGKLASRPYCLMLATYEARKGHDYLLQAFQDVRTELPHVELRIYGYGREHEKRRVRDEIRRLGLEGSVSTYDFSPTTAGLISGASVLVVPSQAHESFGLTIVEAMAFGIPVVATDTGGIPEVLGGTDAGFVISRKDPSGFAAAIKRILANPQLAAEMGRNGRRAFEERFAAARMAKQYASLVR
jgi:glycosyltransferase involved in cell wall biosynthesis